MSSVSVSDLINNFASACRALIPALDYALVPWQEGKQYDNWERIEEALFKSLVAEPCEHEALAIGKTAIFGHYGFRVANPQSNAKIIISFRDEEPNWRYVRLASLETPFDAIECVRDGQTKRVPLDSIQFRFIVGAGVDELIWFDIRLDL